MTTIKAWSLHFVPVSIFAALFWPWHHAPIAVPAAPPVVQETAAKAQDVWPKIEGQARVVLPTDIRPMDMRPAAEAGTPLPPKPAAKAPKAKRRPQRHVLSQPEPQEDDWASRALKAAARLAGAIQ